VEASEFEPLSDGIFVESMVELTREPTNGAVLRNLLGLVTLLECDSTLIVPRHPPKDGSHTLQLRWLRDTFDRFSSAHDLHTDSRPASGIAGNLRQARPLPDCVRLPVVTGRTPFIEPVLRLVGRPGLDPGTLGLKGTSGLY
jgi:hypothetical protein